MGLITTGHCQQCGSADAICPYCARCEDHCMCGHELFDADELGLDPETDNTPNAGDRHA